MKNNWHLAKERLWLGHMIWVHFHAKYEDLLYTSAVIGKTDFEQGTLSQKQNVKILWP